jgi:hypothetical protein
MKVDVEILHACGDRKAGDRDRVDLRQAQRLIRTGYARLVETTEAPGGEQAVRTKSSTRTVRGEQRG